MSNFDTNNILNVMEKHLSNNICVLNNIKFMCCAATSSKIKFNEQCGNKRKPDSIFCGVHSNVSNDRIFKPILEMTLKNNDLKENVIENVIENVSENIILDDSELNNIINDNLKINALSVTILRNYIKNHNILNNIINCKGSKQSIINELKLYFNNNTQYNVKKIIIIQSLYRRWSVLRRKKCCNTEDIVTMDLIYDIPIKYFYIFNDKVTKKKYGYDIRFFSKLFFDNSVKPKCPYTLREFDLIEIVMIQKYIEKVKSLNITLDIEKPKLTKEQEIQHKCVDIFLRMDMLDNYTQSKWFLDLTQNELLKFYENSRDIWNYRIQMPIEQKRNIINDGVAFTLPIIYLAKLNRIALQNMVLREIDRFISEGINREEKKLGAMIMLTALVEVSGDAAQALPHLVQIF